MDRFTKQADGSEKIEQLTGQYSFDPQRVELYWNLLEVLQDRTYKQKLGGFWRYVFASSQHQSTSKVKGFPVSKTQKPAGNDHFGPIMEENSKPLAVHVIEGVDIMQ